jgi:hypothetical protein
VTAIPKLQRVLLTGDVHGNTAWVVQHVLKQAKRHRCQLVLQMGDWGIWSGREGNRFLDGVDRAAAAARIPVWFIDGNHEDFTLPYSLPLDADGLRPVRDHITHIPRGHRWSWSGRTMLACGGASSVDVMYRLPQVSWWPQEAITRAEVEACIAGGKVDVLFTHDINLEVRMEGAFAHEDLPLEVRNAVYGNQLALQRIVDATQPTLQVHGHWHYPCDQRIQRGDDDSEVRVVSLNCDSGAGYHANGHCAVLDLAVLANDVINSVTIID